MEVVISHAATMTTSTPPVGKCAGMAYYHTWLPEERVQVPSGRPVRGRDDASDDFMQCLIAWENLVTFSGKREGPHICGESSIQRRADRRR